MWDKWDKNCKNLGFEKLFLKKIYFKVATKGGFIPPIPHIRRYTLSNRQINVWDNKKVIPLYPTLPHTIPHV
jgi:hypothetical protein